MMAGGRPVPGHQPVGRYGGRRACLLSRHAGRADCGRAPSAGPALGMAVDVFDDDGQARSARAVSASWCAPSRGRVWTRGLLGRPGALPRHVLVALARTCGWHGDFASVDPMRTVEWFLHGRSDDTIKLAGKRLGPAEVETVVVAHPSVLESAAIGVPDELKGEVLWVYVVLAANAQPGDVFRGEISKCVTDAVEPFKPAEVRFTTALPKIAACRCCAAQFVRWRPATSWAISPDSRIRQHSTRSPRVREMTELIGARVFLRPLQADDWEAWREVRLRCRDWLERWEPVAEAGSVDPALDREAFRVPLRRRGSVSVTSTRRTASGCSSTTVVSRAK